MSLKNPHVLAAWNPVYMSCWGQWLKNWKETELLEWRHSLLQFGFGVETDTGESAERLMFYLDVADGHRYYENFRGTVKPQVYLRHNTALEQNASVESLRQGLAQKAFRVLCTNFFKNQNPVSPPSWSWGITDSKAFEKLLWFLRTNKCSCFLENGDPFPNNIYQEIFMKFVLEFCEFTWKFYDMNEGDRAGEEVKRIQKMFRDARPQIVRILCALGKVTLFLDEVNYPLDLRSLLVLKELAMGEHPRMGIPNSLEEAVSFGISEARVLQLLIISGKEKKRQRKIKEAEWALRETTEKLEKIGKK